MANTKYFIPAILVFITINYLLFFYEPSQGSGLIPFADKIVHSILFASFSATVFYGLYKTWLLALPLRIYAIALVCILLFAGITELIQLYFIEGRSGEWMDFLADLFGVFIGFVFTYKIKKYL